MKKIAWIKFCKERNLPFNSVFKIVISIYSVCREREREREKRYRDLPSIGLSSRCLEQPRWSQAKARDSKLNLGGRCPRTRNITVFFSMRTSSGNWVKTHHADTGCGIPSRIFTATQKPALYFLQAFWSFSYVWLWMYNGTRFLVQVR